MTTDQAAELLATYNLTGSVSETARQLGISKAHASVQLRRAGAVTKPEPQQFANKKQKTDWIAAYSQRETKLLDLVDAKMDDFRPRELIGAVKIIGDARYREEHPELQRGGEGAQVIVPVQVVITQQVEDAI